MKKILSYLLLSSVSLTYLSDPSKATPTNIYLDTFSGRLDPNTMLQETFVEISLMEDMHNITMTIYHAQNLG